MIAAYGISVLLSILVYIWVYLTDVRESVGQNLMVIFVIISNLGYLAIALANDLPEAVLAFKITYLGGSFIPMIYFMTVSEFCKIKISRKIKIALIFAQLVLFAAVCTVGYSDLYYKDISFHVRNGVGFLDKTYGSLHSIMPISIGLYLLGSIIVMIIAKVKKRTIFQKGIMFMLACATAVVALYAIQRIFTFEYDLMSFGYIFLMVSTYIPAYVLNLFSVEKNKDIVDEQLSQVGFISFSKKMRFMGANDFAIDIFRELKAAKAGKIIKNPSDELDSIIRNVGAFRSHVLAENGKGHKHFFYEAFKVGKRHFDTQIHTINGFRNRCVGYTVELKDDTDHYRIIEMNEKYNEKLERDVREKTERIIAMQEKTILGMAQMVESRDLSTGGHIKRTSDVVKIFSKKLIDAQMGFDETFLMLLVKSAPMHDLGKIGVDDAVLRKQGRFTDEEYEKMKKHAEIGGKMVKDVLSGVENEQFIDIAYNVANYHHEKVNGRGYPKGLKGEEIPIEARIMALADVFDALVSKRCYKDAYSYDKAFNIIKEDAGEHFDYDLAMLFLQCRDELEDYYNNTDIAG